jgi:hypothetical protein
MTVDTNRYLENSQWIGWLKLTFNISITNAVDSHPRNQHVDPIRIIKGPGGQTPPDALVRTVGHVGRGSVGGVFDPCMVDQLG